MLISGGWCWFCGATNEMMCGKSCYWLLLSVVLMCCNQCIACCLAWLMSDLFVLITVYPVRTLGFGIGLLVVWLVELCLYVIGYFNYSRLIIWDCDQKFSALIWKQPVERWQKKKLSGGTIAVSSTPSLPECPRIKYWNLWVTPENGKVPMHIHYSLVFDRDRATWRTTVIDELVANAQTCLEHVYLKCICPAYFHLAFCLYDCTYFPLIQGSSKRGNQQS